jgi:hypothetical protein
VSWGGPLKGIPHEPNELTGATTRPRPKRPVGEERGTFTRWDRKPFVYLPHMRWLRRRECLIHLSASKSAESVVILVSRLLTDA